MMTLDQFNILKSLCSVVAAVTVVWQVNNICYFNAKCLQKRTTVVAYVLIPFVAHILRSFYSTTSCKLVAIGLEQSMMGISQGILESCIIKEKIL